MPTTFIQQERTRTEKSFSINPPKKLHEGSISTTFSFSQDTKPDRVRSRKPSGWLMPKAYVREVQSGSGCEGFQILLPPYSPSNTMTVREGNLTGIVGAYSWPGGSAPSFPSSLVQRAEVKALLALKEQKVNLALAYRERKLTADLLGDTAFRLSRGFQATRRRDWREVARQLKVAPGGVRQIFSRRNGMSAIGRWLELQYGWKPLLSDVYGAASILQSRTDPTKWMVSVVGKSSQAIDSYGSTTGQSGMNWSMRGKHGCKVRLDYEPGNAFLSALSKAGFSNPLSLNWEMLPFSFVVDWALPIGDWLNSLDAAAGYNFRSGSCSRWTEVDYKLEGSNCPSEIIISATGSRRYRKLDRTIYSSSPLPFPPSVKNPLSLTHMANGLSLLAQVFGKR